MKIFKKQKRIKIDTVELTKEQVTAIIASIVNFITVKQEEKLFKIKKIPTSSWKLFGIKDIMLNRIIRSKI